MLNSGGLFGDCSSSLSWMRQFTAIVISWHWRCRVGLHHTLSLLCCRTEEFEAHSSSVSCLALGKSSGRLLATGGEDCRVNLWAVSKANCIMVRPAPDQHCASLWCHHVLMLRVCVCVSESDWSQEPSGVCPVQHVRGSNRHWFTVWIHTSLGHGGGQEWVSKTNLKSSSIS